MTAKRIAGILTLLCTTASSLALAAEISIQPETQTVGMGESFTVNISISDVSDLYAFQFDLGFNPEIINGISIEEGTFLSTAGSTFFLAGTVDNGAGTIDFTADSLLGPMAGASGSGTLAIATFQAVGENSSSINLINALLIDSTGASISFVDQPGSVFVASPEPVSILLMGAALFGSLAATLLKRWLF